MRLRLPRHPDRLNSKHPLIIEELLGLAHAGQTEALKAMIEMLRDLHLHGRESRFLRTLKGYPICKLKTSSRGGTKGGSRVYLFINNKDEALIVNCEVKEGDEASQHKLKEVLLVAKAYKDGVAVLEGNQDAKD